MYFSLLSFDLWTFQMLLMGFFCLGFFVCVFLNISFGPDCEVEANLTWEKLSFSRNWGFLKVERAPAILRWASHWRSSSGFADRLVHGKLVRSWQTCAFMANLHVYGKLVLLWQARGSSSDKAKAGLSGQDPGKWGLVAVTISWDSLVLIEGRGERTGKSPQCL